MIAETQKKNYDSNCRLLRKKVKANITSNGLAIVQEQMNYLRANPKAILPVDGLSYTDTIEIFQQCITDRILKLESDKIKSANL